MTYPIDLYNVRDTQDEKTRKRLARYHRREARLMARKSRIEALFNIGD